MSSMYQMSNSAVSIHSSLFASTMAPIIATSSSIEAISNGIR